MEIALVRVDNRLVHGQIIEAWVPFIHAGCIVVVDDDVASDFFRKR
jgi:PTS system mannose-specific IIB component